MVRVVIGIGQVRDMFDRLVERSESREDVARFASVLLHKFDCGDAEAMVPAERNRIRRGLNFLAQADLLIDEHHYRFTLQDFIEERRDLNLD